MSIEQWVTWGLQALIGLVLTRLWNQLDRNTRAVSEINLEIHKAFATKTEWEQVRARLHDLENYVAGLRAIDELKKVQALQASSENHTTS